MPYLKSYTQEVVVAANANIQRFTLTTDDNWQEQHIKKLFVDNTTARLNVGLNVVSKPVAVIAAPAFAAGNGPQEVDVTAPAQQAPVFTAQDLTGTGVAHLNVTIWYEVNQQ